MMEDERSTHSMIRLVALAIIVGCMWLVLKVTGQPTRLDPSQVAPTIAVVQWAKCVANGTNPDGSKWDCAGLDLYQFRMSDGSLRGPFVATPVDPTWAVGAKWVSQPIK